MNENVTINFIQVNQNHCKLATDILNVECVKKRIDVGLIQEPYVCGNEVRNIQGMKVLYDITSEERPRACLLFHNNRKFLPLNQFCSRDVVTAMIELNDSLKVVVCSAYLPGDTTLLPIHLRLLLEYCRKENLHLIVGCDANAHHTVWECNDVNARGKIVLELISENNLEILNQGSYPTYSKGNVSSIIDLTLTSQFLRNKIINWAVSKEFSGSDHRQIFFTLEIGQKQVERYRIPQRTDWSIYVDELEKGLSNIQATISNKLNLNSIATRLNKTIIDAFHSACPEIIKNSNRSNSWWNKKLERLRKNVRKMENYAYGRTLNRAGMESEKQIAIGKYKEALTNFNKEVRAAKRKSWKTFTENLSNTNVISRAYKLLSKGHSNLLGTLKKEDGSYTNSSSETLELMARSHFPSCKFMSDVGLRDNDDIGELDERALMESRNIFTYEAIGWSIDLFEPYKSSGPDGIFPALLQKGKNLLIPYLNTIFVYSYAMSHIPECWNDTKVIYIPKIGRKPTDIPKAY